LGLRKMNKKLDNKLCKEFPNIFKERNLPMSQTCMCWGFPGDGWYKIIHKLCTNLKTIQMQTGIHITAQQVKEKFGTLRFYISINTHPSKLSIDKKEIWCNIIHDLISYTEYLSSYTCEIYGESGELRRKGWVVTLCKFSIFLPIYYFISKHFYT